jgi:hypothetical protein
VSSKDALGAHENVSSPRSAEAGADPWLSGTSTCVNEHGSLDLRRSLVDVLENVWCTPKNQPHSLL